MASTSKRSWKLQEFTAHDSNVNCLALGHKSGRVLATGGDDKKVNLWAVGKPNCIMSLSGHATPIESVRFNYKEELVCAGSQTGALKVWDLEAAKLVKTLTGHKSGISSLDFHPYGDFIASGSHDNSIKLWDPRRKGCILTFIGHRLKVNSLKFSPDGQWIASSSDDSIVKVWDIRQGRTLHEFTNHTNSVTSVEFHPHDFLLASGGLDRTVNFWDLENFQLVSSEKDVGAVKCLWFNPDGECLFTGVTDSLKVLGWEPSRVFDSIPIGWGKVYDIATAHHQLVGASFHLTNVTVYVVDTKKVQPFGGPTPEIPTSPFSPGQSIRKSFSKERPVNLRTKTKIDVKTIEESTSGTDPEEDISADITNINDYTEVFQPNRALQRTPPPAEPFKEPESDADPSEPQILSAPEDDYTSFTLHQLSINNDNSSPPRIRYSPPQIKKTSPRTPRLSPPESYSSPPRSLNSEPENRIPTSTPYSRSQSNLEQIFKSRDRDNKIANHTNKLKNSQSPPKYDLQRQYSCKDVPEKLPSTLNHNNNNNSNNNGIKHSVSDVNINSNFTRYTRSRKNSFSNTTSNVQSSRHSHQSQSNRNSSISNLSRIPNPVPSKLNDDHNFKRPDSLKPSHKYASSPEEPMFKKPDPPKPLNLKHEEYSYKRSDPVDIHIRWT